VLLCGALATCSQPLDEGVELLECERLAFVPRGTAVLFPNVRCAARSDLLVDRFEVTRGLWSEVSAAHPGSLPDLRGRLGQDWSRGGDALPAVGMDQAEARDLAQLRGMRLPTVEEWLYVASGSRAQYWPWGNSMVASVANTVELGLGRAAPVGTFPNGRTSGTGVCDMLGNVWEWTDPPLLAYVSPAGYYDRDEAPTPYWVMGGSYLYPARPLHEVDDRWRVRAQGCEGKARSIDLGMRCVVDAEPFILARAAAWSDSRLRARVVAVGEEWGRRATGLLERLAAAEDAPPAIGWLLEGARR